MKNFWQNKTRLRRFIPLKNRTMYIIGQIAEQDDRDVADVIEKMIEASPMYKEKIAEVAKMFPDVMEEG